MSDEREGQPQEQQEPPPPAEPVPAEPVAADPVAAEPVAAEAEPPTEPAEPASAEPVAAEATEAPTEPAEAPTEAAEATEPNEPATEPPEAVAPEPPGGVATEAPTEPLDSPTEPGTEPPAGLPVDGSTEGLPTWGEEPPGQAEDELFSEPAEPAPAGPPPGADGHPAPGEPTTRVTETPIALPGEQIEWQPVVTGEQIEWQPVMSSDPDAGWSGAAAGTTAYQEEYEGDAGWNTAAAPATGNGAHGPGRSTAGLRPGRPGATTTRRGDGPPPTKLRRQVVVLSALTAIILLVGVVGFVLSRGATKKAANGPTPTSSVPVVTVAPADLVTFHDDLTGFTFKYPKTWRQLGSPVADIRLTLEAGPNDGFQVRIFPIQTPATTDNIGNFKAVTDTIVFGNIADAKEIQEQLVTLNGRLAYYYIFTFPDKASGQEGLHVTYFVFEGHRMFELVVQAIPSEDIKALGGIMDQVVNSFVIDPEKPTTTTPPGAAASTTSVP